MTVEQLLIVIGSLENNSISASTGRCVECGEAANMGRPEQFAHGNECETDVAIRLLQHELFEVSGGVTLAQYRTLYPELDF